MSGSENDGWKVFGDVVQGFSKAMIEARAREDARRAALTSEQRRAEDEQARRVLEQQRRQAAAMEIAKGRSAVEKAATPYRQHESFTLLDFACLLHGHRPPGAVDRWTGMGPHEEDAAVVNTRRVLGSAVRQTAEPIPGMPLYPVNPGAPEQEHRFPRRVLLEFAREKALGNAAMLWDVLLGPRPTTAAAPVAAPAASAAAMAAPTSPAVARPLAVAVPPKRQPWQGQADALMEEVIAALRARAEGAKRSYDAVRADFGRKCSVKALHEELSLGRGVAVGEEPQEIGLDSFRRYLLKHYRQFKFAGGRPKGDRDFLKALLEG